MKSFLIATLLICSFAASASQGVREGEYTALANAPAICHAARPFVDTGIRYRPIVLENAGKTSAFVSCSFITNENTFEMNGQGHRGIEWFSVGLYNNSAYQETISCVAVIGYTNGYANYITKTATINAGAGHTLTWDQSDNGGQGYEGPVGFSCLLPAQSSIGETRIHWDYNDAIN